MPPRPRWNHCLEDPQQVLWLVFWSPAWGCSSRADHQGAGCAHSTGWSNWSREGTPGVILGVPLPRIQHAPFIVSLQAHSVSCSEAGGGSETPYRSFSYCPPALTLSRGCVRPGGGADMTDGPCSAGAHSLEGQMDTSRKANPREREEQVL